MLCPPPEEFWTRPVGSRGGDLIATTPADARIIEAARVCTAESAARESLLELERVDRVEDVRAILNLLHLQRTVWGRGSVKEAYPLLTPQGGRKPLRQLNQAPGVGRGSAPDATQEVCGRWSSSSRWYTGGGVVGRQEQSERGVILRHEAEGRQGLTTVSMPLCRRLASAVRRAHIAFAHVELQHRDGVARDEEKGWERLMLERQVLGRTARVLQQFSQEHARTDEIDRKLSEFGWRSYERGLPGQHDPPAPVHVEEEEEEVLPFEAPRHASPAYQRRHISTLGDDGGGDLGPEPVLLFCPVSGPETVAAGGLSGGYYYSSAPGSAARARASTAGSPPRGSWMPAEGDVSPSAQRLRRLQDDSDFLESHVIGLQTLRDAETDRLAQLREQVLSMDHTIRERRRQLAELDVKLTRAGARRPGDAASRAAPEAAGSSREPEAV